MTLARAHNRHTVPLTVSVILDLNSRHYQGQIKPVVRVGVGLEASGLQITAWKLKFRGRFWTFYI